MTHNEELEKKAEEKSKKRISKKHKMKVSGRSIFKIVKKISENK